MPVFAGAAQDQTLTDRIAANLRAVGTDDRVRELQRLWATYWGTVYDLDLHGVQLAEWEQDTRSNGDVIPIGERKPAVRYCYGAALVDRVVSLFGEPTLRVVVDGETSPDLTAALGDLLRRIGWHALWDTVVLGTLIQGSGCASIASRGLGRLRRKAYMAHEVYPVFGADAPDVADRYGIDDDDLAELRVSYVYPRDVDTALGRQRRWFLFRRDLTPVETITYDEVDVTSVSLAATVIPKTEAPGGRVRHGLGFVPAVWVRWREIPGEVDGPSLFSGIEDILAAIDRQASQRYRACETHGDPKASPKNAEDMAVLMDQSVAIGARRMLPVPVELLEISASGQEAQAALVRDLQRAAQERTGVYVHDPERSGGALSGVAQEQLYLPTVSLVRRIRGPIGESVALLAAKAYRLARVMDPAHAPVPWPEGAEVVAEWGPVIPPTTADAQAAVAAVVQAKAGGLVSARTAVGYVSRLFGVGDPDEELERIREEQAADLGSLFQPTPGSETDPAEDAEDEPAADEEAPE